MLNLIFDESININKDRVINISIWILEVGGIYWKSEVIAPGPVNAKYLVDYVRETYIQIQNACDGVDSDRATYGGDINGYYNTIDASKLSAISTDTCNSMRKVWTNLIALPAFKHILIYPCTSHGLQLFSKT
jgi:hypothetical protein